LTEDTEEEAAGSGKTDKAKDSRLPAPAGGTKVANGNHEQAMLMPAVEALFQGCMPTPGFLASAKGLAQRMAFGLGAELGSVAAHVLAGGGHEESQKSQPADDFLKAACLACDTSSLARAKLFAQRQIAEGAGLSIVDLVALRLFLVDTAFHTACSAAWTSQAAHQPIVREAERATELHYAHTELSYALRAIPAKNITCLRACRLNSPGGTLREILRGHRHGMDCYRPGSIVLWRHAASATTDPALAEEIALHGQPTSGCSIVFKIRRATGARSVAWLSEYPEQGEVIFPQGSAFRVVGLYPCTARSIYRGVTGDNDCWAVDVGVTTQGTDTYTWDEACRARSIVILLDEEDPSVAQHSDTIF